MKSSKRNITVLKQICNLIPSHLVPRLAREHGVDKKARTFSPWSHVVTLLHVQLSHALSINDVCETLFPMRTEIVTRKWLRISSGRPFTIYTR
jgi:hypothetical protein